jgi:hypothetical protein
MTNLFLITIMVFIRYSATSFALNEVYNEIIYLDFSTPISALPPLSPRSVLSAIHFDDSPFSRVKLPWAFNFFGNKIYNIFVNPNGAIHETQDQPCECACFGQEVSCDFNTSYNGLIAGFLADLDPSHSSTPNITTYIKDDMVSIIFSLVPFFGTIDTVSFRISLFNDSRAEIAYDDIMPDQTHSSWITGFRSPLYTSNTILSASQLSTGKSDWASTGSSQGVYPIRNNVKSGFSFTTCPMSLVWGVQPARIKVSTDYIVELRPLFYSCSTLLDIALYVKTDALLGSDSPDLARCVYQQHSVPTVLLCDLSTLSESDRISVGPKQGE